MSLASPVPTQMTSGSEGATATAPTPPVRTESSKSWVQEPPALEVRQTPPVAAPITKTVPKSPEALGTAAMEEMRPPMRAGPMERKWRAVANAESVGVGRWSRTESRRWRGR